MARRAVGAGEAAGRGVLPVAYGDSAAGPPSYPSLSNPAPHRSEVGVVSFRKLVE